MGVGSFTAKNKRKEDYAEVLRETSLSPFPCGEIAVSKM
jgi:hypothetical protein